MPRISAKNQVTLPVETLERSGLRSGDEVVIESEGPDRIVVRRVFLTECNGWGVDNQREYSCWQTFCSDCPNGESLCCGCCEAIFGAAGILGCAKSDRTTEADG